MYLVQHAIIALDGGNKIKMDRLNKFKKKPVNKLTLIFIKYKMTSDNLWF